jgi:outer membrane murein-binding lipoprotein Lpp
MRARRAVLPAVALLVALTAGCAHHDGASPKTPSASGTPSGYAEMEKKVNAAESAAAAADRDAARDGN